MASASQAAPSGPWLIEPRRHRLDVGAPWPWILPGVGGALAWLDQLGCRPGGRLGLGAANTPAALALLQAAGIGGITVVLFAHRLGLEEHDRQLMDAATDQLAADPGHPLAARGAAPLPVVFPDAPPPSRARGATAVSQRW